MQPAAGPWLYRAGPAPDIDLSWRRVELEAVARQAARKLANLEADRCAQREALSRHHVRTGVAELRRRFPLVSSETDRWRSIGRSGPHSVSVMRPQAVQRSILADRISAVPAMY